MAAHFAKRNTKFSGGGKIGKRGRAKIPSPQPPSFLPARAFSFCRAKRGNQSGFCSKKVRASFSNCDEKKRASVREKVRKAGARLVFIRTHADPHVMLGRMLQAEYRRSPDDFFGGAKSKWEGGTDQQRGVVIKFGEAWRRTPHHYRWSDEGGGKWMLKKLPFRLLADIDTTEEAHWKDEVKKIAQKLTAS